MPSLLLVDDEPELRQILAEELTHAGLFVVQASNGKDASHLIEQFKLDLIITDLVMPEGGGPVVIKAAETAKVPVIILSAGGMNPPDSPVVREFLSKPIDLDLLITTVQRVLATPTPVRHHRRYQVRSDVYIRKESAAARAKAHVLNLSRRGMCIEWSDDSAEKKSPQLSEVLEFCLELKDRPTPVEGRGVIRWVSAETEKLLLGIEFIGLAEEDDRFLEQTLSNLTLLLS